MQTRSKTARTNSSPSYNTAFAQASTPKNVDAIYKKLALMAHPNKGGSAANFQRLQNARNAAMHRLRMNAIREMRPLDLMKMMVKHPAALRFLRRLVSPLIAKYDRAHAKKPRVPRDSRVSSVLYTLHCSIAVAVLLFLDCLTLMAVKSASQAISYTYTVRKNYRVYDQLHHIDWYHVLAPLMHVYLTYVIFLRVKALTKSTRPSQLLPNIKPSTKNGWIATVRKINPNARKKLEQIARYLSQNPTNTAFEKLVARRYGVTTDQLAELGKAVLGGPPPPFAKKRFGVVAISSLLAAGSTGTYFGKTLGEDRLRAWNIHNMQRREMSANYAGALRSLARQRRFEGGEPIRIGSTLVGPSEFPRLLEKRFFKKNNQGRVNLETRKIFQLASQQLLERNFLDIDIEKLPHRSLMKKIDLGNYFAAGGRNPTSNTRLQEALDSNMLAQRTVGGDWNPIWNIFNEAVLIANEADLCRSVSMLPKDLAQKNQAWFGNGQFAFLIDLSSADRRGKVYHVSDTDTHSNSGYYLGPTCGVNTTRFPQKTYEEARHKMITWNKKTSKDRFSFSEVNVDLDADSVIGILIRSPRGLIESDPNGYVDYMYDELSTFAKVGEVLGKKYNVPNFLGTFFVIDRQTNLPRRIRTYEDVRKVYMR